MNPVTPLAADLKPVSHALPALPPLNAAWLELVEFASAYYQRSIGEVALSVLPPELRKLDDAQLANRIRKLHKALAARPAAAAETEAPPLNEAQADALAQIAVAEGANTVLLHGVTGSGKTEVYLGAAARALAAGRQALVLVPEINLTPQLEARFTERFAGRHIVSLHSGLTPAQRLRSWLAAHLGLADLVLGTRLAVFASMPRLGLIVVDEEHDPSYKQQEGARYSARDLAVYRGKLESATVLLGSATPSLETWQRANEGRYKRLALPARIGGGAFPTVRLVDMNQLPKTKGVNSSLSPPLVAALQLRIARGEQSLVFLNRRGYAPVLHCGDCGWKSGCPHCSAWRVFHKLDRTLRCHHCGFTERVPRACPECGNLDIAPLGRGTERLEEQLAQTLLGADGQPARIARIDADSTRLKGALEAQLGAVHAGDVDVLVGTQMVTKGHDFRRITLVAAVNPDGVAVQQRLSRTRTPVRAADAGGRPRRARRRAGGAQRNVGADLAPATCPLRGLAQTRLRGLRREPAEGTRDGGPAAVFTPRDPARRCPHARSGTRFPAGGRRAGRDPARPRGGDDVPAGAAGRGARGQRRAHADAGGIGVARGLAAFSGALAGGAARDTAGTHGQGLALGRGRGPVVDLRRKRSRVQRRRGGARAARPARIALRAGQRPADVGQQQRRLHQAFDRLAQVGRRLQRLDLGQQLVCVFQVVGREVAVQQRERLGQRLRVARHQARKVFERGREAGDPRVHGVDLRRRAVVEPVFVVFAGFFTQLEHPGVEPLAAIDRVVQFGVAAQHQRVQAGRVETRRQRAAVHVGDEGHPARHRHPFRLQQHAAQKAVEHAHVERFQRRGHAVEQRLQFFELAFGDRQDRRARAAGAPRRWARWSAGGRAARGGRHAGIVTPRHIPRPG